MSKSDAKPPVPELLIDEQPQADAAIVASNAESSRKVVTLASFRSVEGIWDIDSMVAEKRNAETEQFGMPGR